MNNNNLDPIQKKKFINLEFIIIIIIIIFNFFGEEQQQYRF